MIEVPFSDRKQIGQLQKKLREGYSRIAQLECELAHAYWASCGCLAGQSGHEDGSPGCAFPSSVQSEEK